MSESRHVSSSIAVLVAGFDAETLRLLAAVAEERDRPRFHDAAQAAEEIAAMVERGTVPTIGWWRRHTEPRPRPSGDPTTWSPHPSPPQVYMRVIYSMIAAGFGRHLAAEAVSKLALEDGIDPRIVEEIIASAFEELAA
ncbi:MAG: hypothetical protein ABSH29_24790 [Acidimicrobiales bacterium]|jgi:pyruvate/2-oxoglutarate dehydrogenase complex dihydrolipoamide acyltransferase (E2) component